MSIGIVYGSFGGHARDCAMELYHSMECDIISSQFDASKYEILIFLLSTAGNGGFPRNFIPIWDDLTSLTSINKFCVFGLGDSRYRSYNYAARRLQSHLEKIGTEFLPLTLGDDQDPLGFRAMFEPWKTKLFDILQVVPRLLYPNIFKVSIVDRKPIGAPIFNSRLLNRHVIVDYPDRKVAELEIELDSQFDLGDVISIHYQVDNATVDKLLNRFSLSDVVLELKIIDSNCCEMGYNIKSGVYKLSSLFTHYFDVNSRVSPWMVKLLSQFSTFDLHVEKLLEFGSPEGLYLFNKYAEYEKRSLLDVFLDFDSLQLTIEQLLNIAPPLFPRLYSISNSPGCISLPVNHLIFKRSRLLLNFTNSFLSKYNEYNNGVFESKKNIAQISVVFMESITPGGRRVKGRCSDWLINMLNLNQKFYATIVSSYISSELREAIVGRPCIFLSTGTGFAACRPWIQQKILSGMGGGSLIISGFRRKSEVLFLRDWSQYAKVASIDFAFSREMTINGSRMYIQHRLTKYGEMVWNLLKRGSLILISGSSHPMPKQVMDSLVQLLIELGFNEDDANDFVNKLESNNRIVFETW